MLKDFFKNMFTDDSDYEDEYEEEEEVTETAQPAPAPQQPAAVVTNMSVQTSDAPLYMEPEIQKPQKRSYIFDPTEQEEEKPADKEEPKKSAFAGLELDSYEPVKKKTSGTYHFDRKKLPKARVSHQNDAPSYQAVLSPIFGNIEEKSKEFDKVHNAIDLPKPNADVVMVQVISPMYGNDLPGKKPIDSIPSYQSAAKTAKAPKAKAKAKSVDLSDMLAQPENKDAQQPLLLDEKGSK